MKNNLYRTHGEKPYKVIALHGGPGASGSLYDLCEELGKKFGVIEILNQGISIDEQIEEIFSVISSIGEQPVILMGHSWGSWLSIYYENAHPEQVDKLILISSGPFDTEYVSQIEKTRSNRMTRKAKEKLSEHFVKINDEDEIQANEHFAKAGKLISDLDSYEVDHIDIDDKQKVDMKIYQQVWGEASKRRKTGELKSALKSVQCPIRVIHGDHDPHPVEGVKRPLNKEGLNAKCFVLSKCGHYPWRERHAKEAFYQILEKLINE